jgi:hypothetical protein
VINQNNWQINNQITKKSPGMGDHTSNYDESHQGSTQPHNGNRGGNGTSAEKEPRIDQSK